MNKTSSSTLVVAFSIFAFSCANDTPIAETVTTQAISIPKTDTISAGQESEISMSADYQKLLAMFEEKNKLPLTIDKKFIDEIEPKDVFHAKEVEMLTANYINHDLCVETDIAVKHFKEIDSVKAKGTYEDWSNSLDLGQIKSSEACPLFKITSGTTVFLFWLFNYSTVEACPYGYSKSVYMTVISNNIPGQTIVFAENSGGGDAPISSEKNVSGTLKADQSMSINVHEELDQDEPKIEVTETFYELMIKDGKYTFTKEDKRPVKMVKKKNT